MCTPLLTEFSINPKEQLKLNLKVYIMAERELDGLNYLEHFDFDLVHEIELTEAKNMENIIHSILKPQIKAIQTCLQKFVTLDSQNKMKQALLNYIDFLLAEMKIKTNRILELITKKILDKVFEYQTLIFILSLIGDINLEMAR